MATLHLIEVRLEYASSDDVPDTWNEAPRDQGDVLLGGWCNNSHQVRDNQHTSDSSAQFCQRLEVREGNLRIHVCIHRTQRWVLYTVAAANIGTNT